MNDQPSLPSIYCIVIPILAGIVVAALIWYTAKSRRVRTVPQGYALRLKRFGRHSRVVGPGLQKLWPDETDAGELLVRRREVTLPISELFTHGGLPVTIKLSFSLSLDLAKMPVDEIYYPEDERQAQLTTLLKGALQRVVAEIPPPVSSQPDPNRIDMAILFSPFAGQTRLTVTQRLQELATKALSLHGIVLSDDPMVIAGIDLPREITDAYTELVQSNFEGSARYDFIRRVRAAAPQIADAALVQLSSKNGVGDLRTIFTSGNLQPELYMADQDLVMRRPAPQAQAPAPPAASPTAPAMTADAAQQTTQNYALTADDMALLRPLRGMH